MHHLIVCGLNYQSSPLAIRERLTIPEFCLKYALNALSNLPHVKEAAVLSTCNRTEVYAVVSNLEFGMAEIDSFFLTAQSIADHEQLKPNFKLLREDAALHLFRVASGLESAVLGEGQIMGQVKSAHQAALDAGTSGTQLNQIFKLALSCGKRVRSETALGQRAVSISSACVEAARSRLGSLDEHSTLVIGAGQMSLLCLKHLLKEHQNGPVTVLNRSQEHLKRLSENRLANSHCLDTSRNFEERYELVVKSDLVIVLTSAPDFILDANELRAAKPTHPILIIDISVPRNVDPKIATIPGITLLNIDDIAALVSRNLAKREALVKEAERIIFEVLEAFHAFQRSLIATPTIAGLRKKMESIRQKHMQKFRAGGSFSRQLEFSEQLDEVSKAIVNQILHHPSSQLKYTSNHQLLSQQTEALRFLFDLDSSNSKCAGKSSPPRAVSVANKS